MRLSSQKRSSAIPALVAPRLSQRIVGPRDRRAIARSPPRRGLFNLKNVRLPSLCGIINGQAPPQEASSISATEFSPPAASRTTGADRPMTIPQRASRAGFALPALPARKYAFPVKQNRKCSPRAEEGQKGPTPHSPRKERHKWLTNLFKKKRATSQPS